MPEPQCPYNVNMPVPLPAWLPELARRRFGFTPAIAGAEPNEWVLERVTWNDVVVRNALSSLEIAIPRHYVGDVSSQEDDSQVVTLLKRLEYSEGAVRLRNRAVVAMPLPSDAPRIRCERPAEVVAIREEIEAPPRWRRYFRILVALGCLGSFIAVYVLREGRAARVRKILLRPAPLVPHSPELTLPVLPQRR